MKLKILYEDNHLIVVYKPGGILSQADSTNDLDMLSIIKTYIKEKYQKPGNVYLGLVHRLDRMTSGIMVFAKTSKAASRLSEQIRTGKFTKKYYAVAMGIVPNKGRLENYLYKNEKEVKSYVVDSNRGKLAVLEYTKIKTIDNSSLLDINLLTGRHHQIRVQMSNIGHPLLGDKLYGANDGKQLMLCAYNLTFYHPISGEKKEFIVKPVENIWDKYFEEC